MAASVDRGCVTAGQTQTLRIQSYPGAVLSYDTTYGDGSYGSAFGGKGNGQVDSTGQFDVTWTVAPGTPIGDAKTDIAANAGPGKSGFASVSFKVAAQC